MERSWVSAVSTKDNGGSYCLLLWLFALGRGLLAVYPVTTWTQIHNSVLGNLVRSQRHSSALALLAALTERTYIFASGSHQRGCCTVVGKETWSKDAKTVKWRPKPEGPWRGRHRPTGHLSASRCADVGQLSQEVVQGALPEPKWQYTRCKTQVGLASIRIGPSNPCLQNSHGIKFLFNFRHSGNKSSYIISFLLVYLVVLYRHILQWKETVWTQTLKNHKLTGILSKESTNQTANARIKVRENTH